MKFDGKMVIHKGKKNITKLYIYLGGIGLYLFVSLLGRTTLSTFPGDHSH